MSSFNSSMNPNFQPIFFKPDTTTLTTCTLMLTDVGTTVQVSPKVFQYMVTHSLFTNLGISTDLPSLQFALQKCQEQSVAVVPSIQVASIPLVLSPEAYMQAMINAQQTIANSFNCPSVSPSLSQSASFSNNSEANQMLMNQNQTYVAPAAFGQYNMPVNQMIPVQQNSEVSVNQNLQNMMTQENTLAPLDTVTISASEESVGGRILGINDNYSRPVDPPPSTPPRQANQSSKKQPKRSKQKLIAKTHEKLQNMINNDSFLVHQYVEDEKLEGALVVSISAKNRYDLLNVVEMFDKIKELVSVDKISLRIAKKNQYQNKGVIVSLQLYDQESVNTVLDEFDVYREQHGEDKFRKVRIALPVQPQAEAVFSNVGRTPANSFGQTGA